VAVSTSGRNVGRLRLGFSMLAALRRWERLEICMGCLLSIGLRRAPLAVGEGAIKGRAGAVASPYAKAGDPRWRRTSSAIAAASTIMIIFGLTSTRSSQVENTVQPILCAHEIA